MNAHHRDLLTIIQDSSGEATQHTFSDAYLGNTNPRYAINAPTMRLIAREWMNDHRDISAKNFTALLDSLVKGKSSTEKLMAGILLDYAKTDHLALSPKIFDEWLEHLTGWAEVDVLCTGKFTIKALPADSKAWSAQLKKFCKSKNISKRRASLVFLCSPLRYHKDETLAATAFANIEQLKGEKEILITKAISWLLRSMVKLYKKEVANYIRDNKLTLPSIAVRETLKKIETGKKT